jgi:hypothetical protein
MEHLSPEDQRALTIGRRLLSAPLLFGWNWSLKRGGALKIEISGRWDADDVAQIRTLVGLVMEIIDAVKDDRPTPSQTPDLHNGGE